MSDILAALIPALRLSLDPTGSPLLPALLVELVLVGLLAILIVVALFYLAGGNLSDIDEKTLMLAVLPLTLAAVGLMIKWHLDGTYYLHFWSIFSLGGAFLLFVNTFFAWMAFWVLPRRWKIGVVALVFLAFMAALRIPQYGLLVFRLLLALTGAGLLIWVLRALGRKVEAGWAWFFIAAAAIAAAFLDRTRLLDAASNPALPSAFQALSISAATGLHYAVPFGMLSSMLTMAFIVLTHHSPDWQRALIFRVTRLASLPLILLVIVNLFVFSGPEAIVKVNRGLTWLGDFASPLKMFTNPLTGSLEAFSDFLDVAFGGVVSLLTR